MCHCVCVCAGSSCRAHANNDGTKSGQWVKAHVEEEEARRGAADKGCPSRWHELNQAGEVATAGIAALMEDLGDGRKGNGSSG